MHFQNQDPQIHPLLRFPETRAAAKLEAVLQFLLEVFWDHLRLLSFDNFSKHLSLSAVPFFSCVPGTN